jgi:hypothetical protein
MATNSQLQITSLDFDTIKQNFITFLQSQSQFQDYNFQGSAINILLDVLSYNTFYNAFYMNMVASEMFLDSAILRQNIVSHAKLLGYTPTSATASQAFLNVVVQKAISDSTLSLNLPRFTQFATQTANGSSYSFYTVDDTGYVANNGTSFTFNDVQVKQGTPVVKSFIYTASSNPTQSFSLVDQGIDISTLQVVVQTSTSNPSYNVFTLAQDATQVTANSNVYFINEDANQSYVIYFGDGIIGTSLQDQNIIKVSYLITDADAANGLQNFSLQTALPLSITSSTVTTTVPSAGGSPIEDANSIKFAAPLSFVAQNRIVTKNDYISQINKRYPYFDAVTVWGGEELVPPIYGKVFVSAKPKNGFVVTAAEQNYLINDIIRPISVLTVTPVFVQPDYNFLNFTINVNYDTTKTVLTSTQLQSAVGSSVNTFVANYLNKFNASFAFSKFLATIDATDPSIQSSSVSLYIEKQITPTLNKLETYTINYGTPLHRGITNDRVYTSPYFISQDSHGNDRQCYIEETPYSFSGIDGYIITNPGSGYTSAPSIAIDGDGVGANAYAVIVNGQVASVVIDKSGENYTTAAFVDPNSGSETLTTGGGTGAQITPVLGQLYGTLRTYYFDSNHVKQIINPNAGTIDYNNGIVTLQNFYATSIGNDIGILSVFAEPVSDNFSSNNNIIITYDPTNPKALTINLTKVSS